MTMSKLLRGHTVTIDIVACLCGISLHDVLWEEVVEVANKLICIEPAPPIGLDMLLIYEASPCLEVLECTSLAFSALSTDKA